MTGRPPRGPPGRPAPGGAASPGFHPSGGHLFPIFDGAAADGISLIDVRHEATAVFAAEGWAKVTRTPGVAAVMAGPGVTNDQRRAAAEANNSPLVLLGGRAPAGRWGEGSLQEIDHLPRRAR